MSAFIYVYHMCVLSYWSQRVREYEPLDWSYRCFVSHVWMLGRKPSSPLRETSACNHRLISLAKYDAFLSKENKKLF